MISADDQYLYHHQRCHIKIEVSEFDNSLNDDPRAVSLMLITKSTRFIQAPFDSEAELEQVVIDNSGSIFGPSSIYLQKALILTPDGFGTIPDGFAFDLSKKQWFIVEAELAKHNIWTHIAPQVAKQITAASKPESKRYLVERVVSLFREDQEVRDKFEEEGIELIDIRKVLDQILATQPFLGMPIDSVSSDLREWAMTSVKLETKLWIVKSKTCRTWKSK